MTKRFILLALAFLVAYLAKAQNCGLEAPLPILPNQTHLYEFEIFDVVNNDLANPNQGVCGIEIFFGHNYISDLEIWIISPSGQSVQIIGPNTNDFDAFTIGGLWNIEFVPCGDSANPDFPYASNWNNAINDFIPVGNFDGSYYPFIGCLEDFNSGSVNGIWTIQVVNNPTAAFIPGQIFDFRLVLCDDTGQNCCFAEAGNLVGYDPVELCQGDSLLILDQIAPSFGFTENEADSTEYGYTYAIGQDGIFVGYDSLLDLRTYAAGMYELCGLSYKRMDSTLLLVPDGILSIDALRDSLNQPEPPLCSEMTDSCVQVRIFEVPAPTVVVDSICAGDIYILGDSTFSLAGNYEVILTTQNACDSIIDLDLSVLEIPITTIDSTICEGESVTIGNSIYGTVGSYSDTLMTTFGCDSIVQLDLTVLAPIDTAFTAYICSGDSYQIGTSIYTGAGIYSDTLVSSQACDSIVHLTLEVLELEVVFAQADTLTCSFPTVNVDGSASTSSGTLAYAWTDLDGNSFGDSPMIVVDSAGQYILQIIQMEDSVSCTEQDTLDIIANFVTPIADAGMPGALSCQESTIMIGGPATSVGSEFTYTWSSPDGNFVGTTTAPTAEVDEAGIYTLLVTDLRNGCLDSTSLEVLVDTLAPIAVAETGIVLDCDTPQDTIFANGSSIGSEFIYSWSGPCIISDPDALNVTVDCPGDYTLEVSNINNGCSTVFTTSVLIDTLAPIITFTPPPFLNCEVVELDLETTVSNAGSSFMIEWEATNGGNITNNINSLSPNIDQAGSYTLTITNPDNACASNVEIIVQDTITSPIAVIQTAELLTCDIVETTLDGTNSSMAENVIVSWNTINGNILSDTTQYTIDADQPGLYTLAVLDTLTRCSSFTGVSIQQDTIPPLAEAGEGFLLNCSVLNGTLNGSNSAQGVDISYQWTGPCINSDAVQQSIQVDCPGIYYLEVRNTMTGCFAIDSVIVVEDLSEPIAMINSADSITCVEAAIVINANSSSQSERLIYEWTGPSIVANGDSLNPIVDLEGEYTLIITDTISTCTDTASILVESYTFQPTADAGPNGMINCQDTILSIGTNNTSIGPNMTYEWFSNESAILDGADSLFALVDTAGVFVLFATDTLSGCADTSFVTISEDISIPFADAGADIEINCSVESVMLDVNIGGAGNSPMIQWTGDCINGAATNTLIEVNCPDVYYVSVTNPDNFCVGLDSVEVAFDSLAPIADLSLLTEVSCETGDAIIDGSASSAGFYQWFFEGNAISGTQNTLLVNDLGAYQLVVSNLDMSCTDTATTTVILDCAPEIIVADPDTISCLVSIITLDASASISPGPITFSWTADDSSCILSGGDTPNPEVQCGGEFTVVATNTEVNQSDTLVITVPIDTISPIAHAGFNDTITCAQPFAVIDGSLSSQGEPYTYAWSQSLFDVFSTEIQDTVMEAGTYLLTVTDTINGCGDSDVVTVIDLRVNPTVAFSSAVFPCNVDTFNIQGVVSPASVNYAYSWTGDGILGAADGVNVSLDTSGIFVLNVLDTINQCSVVDTIEVLDQICLTCVEILPPDTLTCSIDSLTIEASYCLPCVDCEIEWTTLDGTINSGGNTLSPVVSSGGTYEIEVTDTLDQITVFSVTVMEDRVAPIADAGMDRLLTCDSLVVSLSGNTTSIGPNFFYEWTALSGNTPLPSDQPILLSSQVDTFILRVRNDLNACQAVDTVVVGEDIEAPLAEAGEEQALSCETDLVILEGGSSSIGLIYEYTWTSANNANISGPNTINPIVTDSDLYFLNVRDTTNGCTAIDSVFVNELFEIPTFDSLSNQIINCQDTFAILSTMINEDSSFSYSYEWCLLDEFDQTIVCTDTALSIQVDNASRWRFEVVNDSTACANEQIVEIIEDIVVPQVEAGTDLILLCTQDSIQLSGSGSAMGALVRSIWTSDDSQEISNDTLYDPFVYQAGTYFLTVTDTSNFCTALDSMEVLRDENTPEIDAGNDSLLSCKITSISLSANFMTESGNADLEWFSPDNHPIEDPNSSNPTISEAGIYYVTISDPDNLCSASDSLQIFVNTNHPIASVELMDGTLLNCLMDTLLLDATNAMVADSGAIVFEWQTSDGNIIGLDSDSIIQVNQAGSYQLVVTDDFNGCRDTVLVEISADLTLPDIVFNQPDTISCDQSIVLLDASNSTPMDSISYQWERADGILILSDTFPTIEVTNGGSYTLTLTDLGNGCISIDSIAVSVDTIAPMANIQAFSTLDCDTREIDLVGVGSSIGDYISYVWFTSDGTIIGPIDSIATLVSTAGTYTLQVINDENGCSDEEHVEVIAEEAPILGIEIEVAIPRCIDEANGVIRILDIQGGTFPFVYAIDDEAYTNQGEWINLSAGAYTLSILDANGCEWIEEVIVNAPEEIRVDLGVDITIGLGDSTRLEAMVNIPYDTLIWMPVDSFADSSNPVQVVQVNEASYYNVLVVDENGCIARDSIIIFVDKVRSIFVPTAFSPNDDGNNDVFMVFAGKDVKEIKSFKVFDRWGNQVFGKESFQPNDPFYGWDGHFNGQEMNSAVYVYFVEFEFIDGWIETQRGDVLLMR